MLVMESGVIEVKCLDHPPPQKKKKKKQGHGTSPPPTHPLCRPKKLQERVQPVQGVQMVGKTRWMEQHAFPLEHASRLQDADIHASIHFRTISAIKERPEKIFFGASTRFELVASAFALQCSTS